MATQQAGEIKYLTPIAVDTKKKKYCRFKKVVSSTSITRMQIFF
jgi:hypothetical protein